MWLYYIWCTFFSTYRREKNNFLHQQPDDKVKLMLSCGCFFLSLHVCCQEGLLQFWLLDDFFKKYPVFVEAKCWFFKWRTNISSTDQTNGRRKQTNPPVLLLIWCSQSHPDILKDIMRCPRWDVRWRQSGKRRRQRCEPVREGGREGGEGRSGGRRRRERR